ncbi:hypothetical protein NP590_16580 [Methylomonas sp. SURF-2]|uniref:Macro domain-containing protein n=1 Tax=Methylomonas subterranea TaxID=2952225 RepID=A0ABT1TK86_9GAMM|nr:hypothetical protein [Methylomonas sp. SURF-2]MCQ8105729.1 hypothetical protein [Methylomonas sp. SURF-2]
MYIPWPANGIVLPRYETSHLLRTHIKTLAVNAIVNAANNSLLGAGGCECVSRRPDY